MYFRQQRHHERNQRNIQRYRHQSRS
jgi:hypothetical protein